MTAKRPAFQFYPGDWRRDPALRVCSLAARGLWIEIMCIAHECEPYGVLAVNGKAMTAAQIARHVGEPQKVVESLLAELEDAGVFSRDEEGRIFSRRMVRDERVRAARKAGGEAGAAFGYLGAEHGKKGGRPRTSDGGSETPLKTPLQTPLDGAEKPPPSSSSSSSEGSLLATLGDLSGSPPDVAHGSEQNGHDALPDLEPIQVGKVRANRGLVRDARGILDYLNSITGKGFRPVTANIEPIVARLKEGYSAVRLKEIAMAKTDQWGSDERMCEYLRPATLYGAQKCAQYDGELGQGG